MEGQRKDSIAVLGGSGFVGSSLARHLSRNFDVTVIDRTSPKSFAGEFKQCDIRDQSSLTAALRGSSLVINCAIIQLPEINEKRRLGYEVNVQGVQNICEAVESTDSIRGLLHVGSWHVFGERGLRGTLGEDFGFHPDKVDERARFYALCKIAQESIIGITAEMSQKLYGIIRLGTVLGEEMPKQTAANLFIESALKGEPMTPFRHTQHRPMLYIDIDDVCNAFESFTAAVLRRKPTQSPLTVVNLAYPRPVTILELARIVRKKLIRLTHQRIVPKINVIDKHLKPLYGPKDARAFRLDVSSAQRFLGLKKLASPEQTIERIIQGRINPNRS